VRIEAAPDGLSCSMVLLVLPAGSGSLKVANTGIPEYQALSS
jgi:hypothetical protein